MRTDTVTWWLSLLLVHGRNDHMKKDIGHMAANVHVMIGIGHMAANDHMMVGNGQWVTWRQMITC